MKSIFEQIEQWIIEHQNDIILLIGVVLISLLSFAMGYIAAEYQKKEPIRIEYNPNLRMTSESANNLFGAFGYDSDGIRIML